MSEHFQNPMTNFVEASSIPITHIRITAHSPSLVKSL